MDNSRLTGWFTYLEEECLSPDGLLCFYDFPRSLKVVSFCKVLAAYLDQPMHNPDQSFLSLDFPSSPGAASFRQS
jgi:hypothetical protein